MNICWGLVFDGGGELRGNHWYRAAMIFMFFIVLYNCLLSTDARIEILFHAFNYQFLN